MNTTTLYILLAVLGALLIAAFLYVYRKKKKQKLPFVLLLLRFLSVFGILLLLINPVWEKEKISVEKPKLLVAVDNSASIKYVKGEKQVVNTLKSIKENKALQEKFDIQYYSFGSQVKTLDSLDYKDQQTNPNALLKELKSLYGKQNSPLLLITDGNQTKGMSYEYFTGNNTVYPVVVGDTTLYKDIELTQLNVNQYAFLDNSFPVEIFANYTGKDAVSTQLSIFENKQRIFTKKISFDADKTSESISFLLPATKVGQHYYSAVLSPIVSEKNTQNNRSDFSIEVVDQQTKVLLLSSFYHPDLGAIKNSIESNKQRKVTTLISNKDKYQLSDYQLIILYQPTNSFVSVFNEIADENRNTIIITGTKTDWNFLNKVQNNFSKNTTTQKENYQGVYNSSFSEFVTKDIDFENLAPLNDVFGKISFDVPFETLLFQKIGSTAMGSPLLATYKAGATKNVVLFGENIWRWRMGSKIEERSFNLFDDFWNTLIQYTAISKNAQQIHLDYEKLRYSNQEQLISVSYVDQNYKVDKKASIWLYLTNNNTNKTEKMPFALAGEQYEAKLPNLNTGNYSFKVLADGTSKPVYGNFKVLDYNVEQQFITANKSKLEKLAQQTGGKLVFENDIENTLSALSTDHNYKSIQKSKKITESLIDWRWLLGFILLSLSAEWFIRKYRGLI